jgi:hypothetical protein
MQRISPEITFAPVTFGFAPQMAAFARAWLPINDAKEHHQG